MRDGDRIGGYLLLRQIGEGGMGVVWMAAHGLLGRKAAIKVLRPEYSLQHDTVTRFFNEARAAAAIPDPGIIQIFDVGHHNGSAYIVMELLEGEALDSRMQREGVLAVGAALRLCRQVASAIGAAHARGIIHRDLKPENIFVVRDPEVAGGERAKVLDFGIAKLAGNIGTRYKTSSSVIIGTPPYMSPEQCRGAGQVDHRSDIYSLGCVLFTLLVGRPPFDTKASGVLLMQHMTDTPPRPSSCAPRIPAEVDALILRCLAKEPADRFESGTALAQAIDSLVSLPAVANAPVAPAMVRVAPTIAPAALTAAPAALTMAPAALTAAPAALTAAPAALTAAPAAPTVAPAAPTVAPAAPTLPPLRRVPTTLGPLVTYGTPLPSPVTPRRRNKIYTALGATLGATLLVAGGATVTVVVSRGTPEARQEPLPAITPEPGATTVSPSPSDDPRPLQARTELRALLAAFAAWAADHAGAPCPTAADLGGGLDPWGHAYEVTCTDQPADQAVGARSSGPDGATGTDDDLVSWALDDAIRLARGPRWGAAPRSPAIDPARPPPRGPESKPRRNPPAAPARSDEPTKPPSDGILDVDGDGIPDRRR